MPKRNHCIVYTYAGVVGGREKGGGCREGNNMVFFLKDFVVASNLYLMFSKLALCTSFVKIELLETGRILQLCKYSVLRSNRTVAKDFLLL